MHYICDMFMLLKPSYKLIKAKGLKNVRCHLLSIVKQNRLENADKLRWIAAVTEIIKKCPTPAQGQHFEGQKCVWPFSPALSLAFSLKYTPHILHQTKMESCVGCMNVQMFQQIIVINKMCVTTILCIVRNFQDKDFSFHCYTHFLLIRGSLASGRFGLLLLPNRCLKQKGAGQVIKLNLRTTGSSRMTISRPTGDV